MPPLSAVLRQVEALLLAKDSRHEQLAKALLLVGLWVTIPLLCVGLWACRAGLVGAQSAHAHCANSRWVLFSAAENKTEEDFLMTMW